MAKRKIHTYEEIRKIAENKKGKCLSEGTGRIKVEDSASVECQHGHSWDIRVMDILRGHWCNTCAINERNKKNTKYTIKDLQNKAKEHKGKCLSKEYLGWGEKHTWECNRGHTWDAPPRDVMGGNKWCRICARNEKGTIEEMRELAKSRNGKCLSTEYINNQTDLIWECEKGHIWDAQPNNVKNGTWCKQCYDENRNTCLEDMIKPLHTKVWRIFIGGLNHL